MIGELAALKRDWSEHLASLGGVQQSCLAPIVPAGCRVALVDWPKHSNAGDAAIWLGELQLARLLGWKVVYVTDIHHYRRRRLAAQRAEVILMHGGGNIGDFYPQYHQFKVAVLKDNPHLRIVQLPQSLNFSRPATRDEYIQAADEHKDFHLLVREAGSLRVCQELGILAELCTDSAYQLSATRLPPVTDISVVARTDIESSSNVSSLPFAADWPERRLDIVTRAVDKIDTHKLVWPFGTSVQLAKRGRYRSRSASLVRGAVQLLSRGRVAIVDRLHAHILCIILGIPHVILDSSNGKVFDHYLTWNKGLVGISTASDADQALLEAGRLLKLYPSS